MCGTQATARLAVELAVELVLAVELELAVELVLVLVLVLFRAPFKTRTFNLSREKKTECINIGARHPLVVRRGCRWSRESQALGRNERRRGKTPKWRDKFLRKARVRGRHVPWLGWRGMADIYRRVRGPGGGVRGGNAFGGGP